MLLYPALFHDVDFPTTSKYEWLLILVGEDYYRLARSQDK
jgi:hypothetical protein